MIGWVRRLLAPLVAGLALVGCANLAPAPGQPLGPGLDAAIREFASGTGGQRRRAQAESGYRALAAAHLDELVRLAVDSPLSTIGGSAVQSQTVARSRPFPGATVPSTDDDREDESRRGRRSNLEAGDIYQPGQFARLEPVLQSRSRFPGLEREGIGLPLVGTIQPGGPNAPSAGYRVPVTLIALPEPGGDACCKTALVDPTRVDRVRTASGDLPVAMDLDAAYSATQATGRRPVAGLANLLRPGSFTGGRPRIVFLQPYDPGKVPVILVHGLLSTPRMWAPLVRELMADPTIRPRFQLWFFYYPSGQPVPVSALQLREALDQAMADHHVTDKVILVGHSMGGILSRVQVSGVTLDQAQAEVPDIAALSKSSLVRRALVFEPRTDVSRVVFMFVPHRGSRLADSSLGAWGIRLIRLPGFILDEVESVAQHLAGIEGEWLPPSIRGLSPDSQFLRVLDETRPTVPVHSVIGDRGRGDGAASSDGVVPYSSAHLAFAESEVVVPTGHGGFAHPQAVAELKRILLLDLGQGQAKPLQR